MMRKGLILSIYGAVTTLLSPLAPALLNWRAKRGKEDIARMGERSGRASIPRPDGPLAWLHGASVGEAMALSPLIDALRMRGIAVVLTTGTVTSARMMEARLPVGAIHQFVPLDVPSFVRRFLKHWRPDLVLLAESELWPNMLLEVARRRIPMALVNARLSERSAARWQKYPAVIRRMLECFHLVMAQTPADASRFSALGAPRVIVSGNLKYDVPALPFDARELAELNGLIGSRPVWVAASTHEGEEEIVMEAHVRLGKRWPDIVTILVPRHPDRGPAIAELARAQGLTPLLRSRGETIATGACLYIADTMGELGLFYRAAGIVFLGKSLVHHGGQNPIEAAKLGSAIVHGPNVENFLDVYRELDDAGGAIGVADAQGLYDCLARLLGDAAQARAAARSAGEAVEKLGGATRNIMTAIEPYLAQTQLERG